MAKLNDHPLRELLAWAPFYAGEPRRDQRSAITIGVWVPGELAQWELDHCWDSGQCRLTRLAAYIEKHLGFIVRTSQGWSSVGGSGSDGLTCVGIPVGIRQVRAALEGS